MIFWFMKCSIKHWWQRRRKGWDDSETWSLDYTISRFIVPRLKRFGEIRNGYPVRLSEEGWDEILNKMIRAHEINIKDGEGVVEQEEWGEYEEGMKLFCDYYRDLWW